MDQDACYARYLFFSFSFLSPAVNRMIMIFGTQPAQMFNYLVSFTTCTHTLYPSPHSFTLTPSTHTQTLRSLPNR